LSGMKSCNNTKLALVEMHKKPKLNIISQQQYKKVTMNV